MNKNKEYILCAAIWIKAAGEFIHQPKNIESGFVICGRRHHNCFAILKLMNYDSLIQKYNIQKIQGFLTSNDRFVSREEAFFNSFVC